MRVAALLKGLTVLLARLELHQGGWSSKGASSGARTTPVGLDTSGAETLQWNRRRRRMKCTHGIYNGNATPKLVPAPMSVRESFGGMALPFPP